MEVFCAMVVGVCGVLVSAHFVRCVRVRALRVCRGAFQCAMYAARATCTMGAICAMSAVCETNVRTMSATWTHVSPVAILTRSFPLISSHLLSSPLSAQHAPPASFPGWHSLTRKGKMRRANSPSTLVSDRSLRWPLCANECSSHFFPVSLSTLSHLPPLLLSLHSLFS